jgi:hypothetical protein
LKETTFGRDCNDVSFRPDRTIPAWQSSIKCRVVKSEQHSQGFSKVWRVRTALNPNVCTTHTRRWWDNGPVALVLILERETLLDGTGDLSCFCLTIAASTWLTICVEKWRRNGREPPEPGATRLGLAAAFKLKLSRHKSAVSMSCFSDYPSGI